VLQSSVFEKGVGGKKRAGGAPATIGDSKKKGGANEKDEWGEGEGRQVGKKNLWGGGGSGTAPELPAQGRRPLKGKDCCGIQGKKKN